MSVTAAVKAAAALLKSKTGRKILKIAVGFAVGIFILIAGVLFTIVNAVSEIGESLAGWLFGGGSSVPPEFAQNVFVQEMQASLDKLDSAVEAADKQLGADKLDGRWVRAVFYTLYFGQPQPTDEMFSSFVECFVTVDGEGGVQPQTDEDTLIQSLRRVCGDRVSVDTLRQARGVCPPSPSSG